MTIAGIKGWYTDTSSVSVNASDIRVGKTIASVTGTLKTDCRSAANLAKFDYEANGVVDVWDTIDDSNQFGAYPSAYPAGWDDHYCGSSLWTDVSRTSGGVPSTCAAGDCIYQDAITKTMWTKYFAVATWADAITACDASTWGNYSDWRLPTQKELLNAHTHGIRSRGDLVSTNAYWAATTSTLNPANAIVVNVYTGRQTSASAKTATQVYACVR